MSEVEKRPLKKMTTPTAKHLAGLISLYQDLRYVMQLTHATVEMIQSKDEDASFQLQTYWSAALNAYARPFKDGIRQQRVPTDIFTGIEGALESHEYFLNQRDKLIAHSVNPFEDVVVGVFVDSNGKVMGVGELAAQITATSLEGFRDLNQLAKIGTMYLMEGIEKYRERLANEASKMSPDELLALDNARFTAPSPEEAGDPRTN